MSTYPGENPPSPDHQPPEGQAPDDQAPQEGAEPTQPVGYWEQQAAEQAPPPPPQNPYGQIPGVNPYGPYDPNQQYGQQYGQPFQAGYPPQPGPSMPPQGAAPYSAYSPAAPDHPRSTLSLVLGLVGLIGAVFLCGLPLVVSPFAWVIGRGAVKEIEASQGRLGGLSQARAGMITGIIGTVFLILAIVAVIGFVVLIVISESTGTSTGSSV